MPRTARQLITYAYYLAGPNAEELEHIDANESADGLILLNDLINTLVIDPDKVQFWKEYTFNSSSNSDEKYFIPKLIEIQTLTYIYSNVRFSLYEASRREYFSSSRPEQVNSLAFMRRVERTLGGCNIYLYYKPTPVVTFTLLGKFLPDEVTLDSDLDLIFERGYQVYLRYKLAQYICHAYNISFREQAQIELTRLEQLVTNISPPDVSSTISNAFSPKQAINIGPGGAANIFRGFYP